MDWPTLQRRKVIFSIITMELNKVLLVLVIGGPSPVAFSASRADLYTRSASSSGSQNIVFDRTETEVGYGWNRGRGVFVCQDPGVYVFSWSAVSPSGTEARVGLYKDGREAGAHTWSDGRG